MLICELGSADPSPVAYSIPVCGDIFTQWLEYPGTNEQVARHRLAERAEAPRPVMMLYEALATGNLHRVGIVILSGPL